MTPADRKAGLFLKHEFKEPRCFSIAIISAELKTQTKLISAGDRIPTMYA